MRSAVLALFAIAGCDWDFNRMNNQPRCETGDSRPWAWLPDHRCDHNPPTGTVAWQSPASAAPPPAPSRALILRGRDRFTRMCAPCHGPLGDGNSIIAADMLLRRPPSLLVPPVTDYPDQRIFEVITQGYGLMPAYTWQLAVPDRWAVVYYVRALERSQRFPRAGLPAARQAEAQPWLR